MSTSKAQLPAFNFEYCTDKKKIFESYCKNMFIRTQSMFVYEGLPDTIPVQWLEQYLQRNGSCVIAKHEGKLYALIGNVAGERDEYYQPTQYIVANPWLKLNKTYDIGKDCVYCRNDYDAIGLTPLVSRYCGLMTENYVTTRVADINMRMTKLLSAADDDTVQSTKQYLKDVEDGKLGVVSEDGFFDGIKMQTDNAGHGDYMIQFIELQQYLKGSLYNELGINANFNMKREAINGEEAALNDDALMPLIDDMLKHRRIMCDQINEMFGLHVTVDYGSSWHSNVVEKEIVGDETLGGDNSQATEMAGDESRLNDDGSDVSKEDVEEVSRLNDEAVTISDAHDSDVGTGEDDKVVDFPNENTSNANDGEPSKSENDNGEDESSKKSEENSSGEESNASPDEGNSDKGVNDEQEKNSELPGSERPDDRSPSEEQTQDSQGGELPTDDNKSVVTDKVSSEVGQVDVNVEVQVGESDNKDNEEVSQLNNEPDDKENKEEKEDEKTE